MSFTAGTMSGADITIYSPQRTTILNATYVANGVFVDAVPLPATGTYTIMFTPRFSYTGNLTFTLHDSTELDAGSIATNGTAKTITTTIPGQNARATFSGDAGQRVSLAVSGVTYGTSYDRGSELNIYDKYGKSVGGTGSFGTNGTFRDPMTLPYTGLYTLRLDPGGTWRSPETGAATLKVHTVPADATDSISFGGSKSIATATPGQNAKLSFDATAGQDMSFNVSASSISSWTYSILRPDGSTLTGPHMGYTGVFRDTTDLPTAGTYSILIDPNGAATGSATVQLHDATEADGGTLALDGSAHSLSMSTPGRNARFTFSGTAGQRVSLDSHSLVGDVVVFAGLRIPLQARRHPAELLLDRWEPQLLHRGGDAAHERHL